MLFPIGRRPLFINGLPAFNLNTLDPLTSSESAGTFSLGLRASYVPIDALRVYGTCASVRSNANAYLESAAVYVIGRGVFYWSAAAGTDTTGEDTSYITNGTGGFVFSTTAYLDFTDALGTPPYRAGRTFYRDNSLNVMTDFPGVSIQLGEESQIQVYNDDATATNNAQVVYAFGPQGQRLAVRKLANGVGDNASRMVGLMTHNVPSHNNGRATTFGLVRDYDTSAFTGGRKVYSSDVAGDLTETIPPGDKDGVRVGFVMNSHPVDGAIFVCPQYIPRLASTTSNLSSERIGEHLLNTTLDRPQWRNSANTAWIDASNGMSIPTAYVEMNTPRGTTSATLEDVTGASVSIVLTKQQYVTIHCSFEMQTQSGASATTIGIALLYDSTTETEYQRYLSGSNDQGLGSIIARTALLDAGTHTVKLQFRRVSGLATPGINKLDLLVSGTVLQ